MSATDILPAIASFIGSGMMLVVPLALWLPDKLQKHYYPILFMLSLAGSVFLMQNVKDVPKKVKVVKHIKEEISDSQKDCLREKHKKGIHGDEARDFCFYECVYEYLDFTLGQDFYGAEGDCESVYVAK